MPVSEVTIADVLEILAPLWYTKAPTAIETVRESTTPSALKLAFEFLVLTAARGGEVRGAVWSEIDGEKGVWTIAAGPMKTAREHRVALCGRALEVVEAALAHIVQNKVEAAYRRTDLFERRRRLMDDWAAYLTGQIRGPEAGPSAKSG